MVLFLPRVLIRPKQEETYPSWQPTTFGEIKLPPPDLLFIACSIMKLAPCRHFVCFFPQVLCRHRYLRGVLCPAMYRYDLQVAKACQWEETTNAACCFKHHDRARTSSSGGGRFSHESLIAAGQGRFSSCFGHNLCTFEETKPYWTYEVFPMMDK